MNLSTFPGDHRNLLLSIFIIFGSAIAAMTVITLHFSSSLTALLFHLSFLIPIAYLLLSASLIISCISYHLFARSLIFLVWSLTAIVLMITYLMYYIARINWGLPMDYKMMSRNLPELPYLIDALPFNVGMLYLGIAIPFLLILIWFAAKSKSILQEIKHLRIFCSPKRVRLRACLIWLPPAVLTAGLYSTPYFQEQINGPFRTLDDPILSLIRLKKVQKQHIIQGIGQNHREAEARYPNHKLPERPNVIFIICDALRADHLGGYGYPRETTPFLDSLMAGDNTFTHPLYFSNTAVSFTGITGTLGSQEAITLHNFMLHEVLKKQGYKTSFFLSGDFIGFYNLKEYLGSAIDVYHDGNTYNNNPYAGKISSADDRVLVLDKLKQLPAWDETPQFMYLHFMSTHQVGPKDHLHDVFKPDKSSLTNTSPTPFINEYDNRVLQLDEYLKNGLRTLTDKGYIDNAIIVITADHGQALMENELLWHGNSTRMEETFIPFIISKTGPTPLPEKRLPTISDQTDAAPTVLDVLGLPKPASWEGTSMFQDNTGNAVYQNESGQYSIIAPVSDRLFQLTYHAKDQNFELTDITEPAAPFPAVNLNDSSMDSLKSLLREHFGQAIAIKVR